MKSKNICKFIPSAITDTLEIDCFIYESNYETMQSPSLLKNHRAILVKSGNGKFIFNDKEFAFSGGSLVFGFTGETFCVVCSDECEYMYISFSGTRSDTLFRRFGINQNNRSFSGFDGLLPLMHESLSRASQINIDLAAESMLLYIFSRLISDSSSQSSLVNSIIEISEQYFNDPELSISSIAKKLSYSSKYLSYAFKEKMGMAYSQYLRTLRIKYAISLFDQGIDSVKNVAFLSGFSDPLYFSTVFKKTIGISPREYKKINIHK